MTLIKFKIIFQHLDVFSKRSLLTIRLNDNFITDDFKFFPQITRRSLVSLKMISQSVDSTKGFVTNFANIGILMDASDVLL